MLKEFRKFIARGNVIELAIAVVIGAAFGRVIMSLVEGVIMPPIGLLLGNVDFSNLFLDCLASVRCRWQKRSSKDFR